MLRSCCILLLLCYWSAPAIAITAFPGAEGFGAETIGGRNGFICKVSNVNDSGEGSLRACIEHSEPRTVIFTTGGVIHLTSKLTISNPYISIFGQTAPGDGIMLSGSPNIKGDLVTISTHDVVIQYLRLRAGTADNPNCCNSALSLAGSSNTVTGTQAYNIIIDHCSFSWATDNVVATLYDVHDITLSNSIIGPSLPPDISEKTKVARGAYFGSAGTYSLSIHHNLFVHNQEHNPSIETDSGIVDFVNNIIYNWGSAGAELLGDKGHMQINLVQNLYVMGPESKDQTPEVIAYYLNQDYQIYIAETLSIRDSKQPEALPVNIQFKDWTHRHWEAEGHFNAPIINTYKVEDLKKKLLPYVGASLPKRDSVDKQVIQDVKKYQGIKSSCSNKDVKNVTTSCLTSFNWPQYKAGKPRADQDNDGMPDEWEKENGLDPTKDDALKDNNANGYTNIEEWVFSLTPPALPEKSL